MTGVKGAPIEPLVATRSAALAKVNPAWLPSDAAHLGPGAATVHTHLSNGGAPATEAQTPRKA